MQPELVGPLQVFMAESPSSRRGAREGPAILLCHGFGATGDDLFPLHQMVDAGPGVRWFFPEAPLALELNGFIAGRAWWPIDLERIQDLARRGQKRTLAEETPEGLAEARTALEATIDELERVHGVRRDKLILGGFSQGAMLTTEIMLHNEGAPFAGLVVLSGTLLSEDRWVRAARTAGRQIHALITHGRADPLLPFESAVALKELLLSAGAEVTWVPHQGEHEIPQAALDGFTTFARARLGAG